MNGFRYMRLCARQTGCSAVRDINMVNNRIVASYGVLFLVFSWALWTQHDTDATTLDVPNARLSATGAGDGNGEDDGMENATMQAQVQLTVGEVNVSMLGLSLQYYDVDNYTATQETLSENTLLGIGVFWLLAIFSLCLLMYKMNVIMAMELFVEKVRRRGGSVVPDHLRHTTEVEEVKQVRTAMHAASFPHMHVASAHSIRHALSRTGSSIRRASQRRGSRQSGDDVVFIFSDDDDNVGDVVQETEEGAENDDADDADDEVVGNGVADSGSEVVSGSLNDEDLIAMTLDLNQDQD